MRFAIVLCLLITGCYAEFDIGLRTPRRDPCTGLLEHKSVYVNPTCRYPAPPPTPGQ